MVRRGGGSDSAGVEELGCGRRQVGGGLRQPGHRQVDGGRRSVAARHEAAAGRRRLVDVLEPVMPGRAAAALLPRPAAGIGGQLAVDGAGAGAVRAPAAGRVVGGRDARASGARLARRPTERAVSVSPRRGHQLLVLVVVVMVTRCAEHLAEHTWIVDVVAAQVAVRPLTPLPATAMDN